MFHYHCYFPQTTVPQPRWLRVEHLDIVHMIKIAKLISGGQMILWVSMKRRSTSSCTWRFQGASASSSSSLMEAVEHLSIRS